MTCLHFSNCCNTSLAVHTCNAKASENLVPKVQVDRSMCKSVSIVITIIMTILDLLPIVGILHHGVKNRDRLPRYMYND